MIVIPFERSIDWRRPPLITFALVAINLLVFLGFQLDDRREIAEVKRYYYESGLAEIELPRYRAYLERRGDDGFVERFGDHLDDPRAPWFDRLIADSDFLAKLEAGEIIAADEAVHERWRGLRANVEGRLANTTVWGHGLRPEQPELADFLTHMFLHGGLFHLIGNMIFLIALGLLVEVALGSLAFTGLYLLGGLGAVGLFMAVHPSSVVPLVGASGAVSGLMGLCAVLYGMRRIRFFYFIGVYFDYVRAPALVLLALWLGKELAQFLLFADTSGVAYTAHIGGLLTGAIAGTGLRFGTRQVDEAILDEPKEQEAFDRRLAEANGHLDAMEPERARPLFERLAREYPNNIRVLEGLFRSARFRPASEAYHQVVQRILTLDTDIEGAGELMLEAFRDYRSRARPKPRLNARNIERIVDLLLRYKAADEAEPLVRAGLKHPERFQGISRLAVRLAEALLRAGQRDKARTLCGQIIEQLPGTEAAKRAERALTRVRSH
jgi:membrane associated rhomboid family serine protease